MPSAFVTARDEIQGLFKEAWDDISPTPPTVQWEGVAVAGSPGADEAFARVYVRHTAAEQSALSNEAGVRKWRRIGIITVQIFTPLLGPGGLNPGADYAIVARDAFQGKATASGVWFRNVRINEIGARDAWFQFNVIAEFEYEEYA